MSFFLLFLGLSILWISLGLFSGHCGFQPSFPHKPGHLVFFFYLNKIGRARALHSLDITSVKILGRQARKLDGNKEIFSSESKSKAIKP